MTPVLEVPGLSYSYNGADLVLDRVDFSCQPGEIVTLLGPNGSGKTTLLQSVLGLLRPRSGSVLVFGRSPHDRVAKKDIGWVASELPQSLLLTLNEYLALLATVQPDFDQRFAQDLLHPFGIAENGGKLLRELSHGMRKKLQLVGAIAHRPKLLLLDEPFSGLDPESHEILSEALGV